MKLNQDRVHPHSNVKKNNNNNNKITEAIHTINNPTTESRIAIDVPEEIEIRTIVLKPHTNPYISKVT